ncbi:hypothetical protein F5984_09720 [Rudanella paleaurantiibacter]|uniref:Uncharacterized protein n=1 Tax=Rudanella paleaurantiibacter TaxID=2614655 RepID=A0A7J5U298_9BACT|nr:hypothetical protein [Rudanella paleaurantiibacter]KAB7731084.1 hypothetical protein F5984_09720 [Rudanella paleaurantiibacter]
MNKIPLRNGNGLQLSAIETVELMQLLYRVANDQTTNSDRDFARSVLERSASLYPEYANVKPLIRPALSPIRHTKKRGK